MFKLLIKILLSIILLSNISVFCYATVVTLSAEDELKLAGIDLSPNSVINVLLNHEHYAIRMIAARFIGEKKMREAIPALIQVIDVEDESSVSLKMHSSNSLAIMGEKKGSIELHRICDLPLVMEYRDKQGVGGVWEFGTARCRASAYLAELGDNYGYRKVIEALNDKSKWWRGNRHWAVYALAKFDRFKNINVLPDLLWALKDEDERVRDAAAGSLKVINKIEAIPHLERAYELEKDEKVKSTMEWCLKSLKQFKLNKEKSKKR